MNVYDDQQFEMSRRDLADEILKQAVLDLRRFHGATSGVKQEFYSDAYRWMTSDDCSQPFSFLNVCQALNLEPETRESKADTDSKEYREETHFAFLEESKVADYVLDWALWCANGSKLTALSNQTDTWSLQLST